MAQIGNCLGELMICWLQTVRHQCARDQRFDGRSGSPDTASSTFESCLNDSPHQSRTFSGSGVLCPIESRGRCGITFACNPGRVGRITEPEIARSKTIARQWHRRVSEATFKRKKDKANCLPFEAPIRLQLRHNVLIPLTTLALTISRAIDSRVIEEQCRRFPVFTHQSWMAYPSFSSAQH